LNQSNHMKMKFLIQKVNGRIVYDFSFTLLRSVEFHNWLQDGHDSIKVKYLDTVCDENASIPIFDPIEFKSLHKNYVPIGSVEFVSAFLWRFHKLKPKPWNVPEVLFDFAERKIYNGTEMSILGKKNLYVKSNEKIKGFAEIIDGTIPLSTPGDYQISEWISIDSEWRALVYKNRLVGLQNYCGEFTRFPDVDRIHEMIKAFEFAPAPIAYTLDVGVNESSTFVIEVHDFFSCGLYGFSDLKALPYMFHRWFYEYIKTHENE
jgi:hypothetical protein